MHDPDDQSAPTALPRRARNPANLYGLVLVLLLGLTGYVPIASARRTARAEDRGEALARLLLEVAQPMQPIDLRSPATAEIVQARLLAAAQAEGVFCEDVQLVPDETPNAFTFTNKHYCVQLRWSLPTEPPPAPGLVLPIEVVAWPLDTTGPAHAAFFYPEDAEPAYSRNLVADYVGLASTGGRAPKPGWTHRRKEGNPLPWTYRGQDDDRWLLLDRRRRARP